MNRNATRTALVTIGLATLAACVVNLSFEMKKTLLVKSDPSAPTTISVAQLVDLSQYKDITDHKSSIKSLDLDYAEATVTLLNSGNAARKVNGSLKLRKTLLPSVPPDDIKVGDLINFPIVVGSTVRLNGNPTLDAFLLQQLQTAGMFYAVIDGSVDGPADLVLDVNMHASIGYDAGLF
jgi:uncharacterized protein involved in exopolysaccharide biosynthesis